MSVNYYDKTTGHIIVVAGGQRLWIGSKAAHDAEVLADKMPYNVLVAILETGLYYRNALGVESPIISGNGDIQTVVLPTASSENLGKILQYTGTTDVNYTHGHFYECVSNGDEPETYSWEELTTGEAQVASITSEELAAMWN